MSFTFADEREYNQRQDLIAEMKWRNTTPCECGCGRDAVPAGKYHDNKCRLRQWQRDNLLPQLLSEVSADRLIELVRHECLRRWGRGRLRIRYGGGG